MDGALHYVGNVDTGFDAKTQRDIGDALEMRADSPFEESVTEPDAVFCKDCRLASLAQALLGALVEPLDLGPQSCWCLQAKATNCGAG